MNEYTKNWLDYCEKGQKAIEQAIDYILMEYGKGKDVNKLELEERCRIKFETYSHPVYTEYHSALETLIQILRITGVLDHE